MKKIVVPAVIAKSQGELDGIFEKIAGHADLVQLDIMDGYFVPNRSLDFDFHLPSDNYTSEAHLMVDDPDKWIVTFGEKTDTIIAHFESPRTTLDTIRAIKNLGKKAALAVNPETKIEAIDGYLKYLDQVLIMTVNPGFYGSPFLPEVMGKISFLRKMKPDLDIEVDGGITPDTIEKVNDAGANLFVSGSYLVKSDKLREHMDILYTLIEKDSRPT
jgi:ribulose-phosphate 3-epimerase